MYPLWSKVLLTYWGISSGIGCVTGFHKVNKYKKEGDYISASLKLEIITWDTIFGPLFIDDNLRVLKQLYVEK